MIPRDYITAWRAKVAWVEDSQVEQDLIISRALAHVLSRILTRYNSHPDYSEWRLVTNFLERGVASPLANGPISVVTKAPLTL